jgi:hypothetical protein
MDEKTHKHYFARIHHNTDPAVIWPPWVANGITTTTSWGAGLLGGGGGASAGGGTAGAGALETLEAMWTEKVAVATKDRYEAMLTAEILQGYHIQRIEELTPPTESTSPPTTTAAAAAGAAYHGSAPVGIPSGVVVVWLELSAALLGNPDYKVVGEHFGVWHEYARAAHNGIHRFYYEGGLSLGLDNQESPSSTEVPGVTAATSAAAVSPAVLVILIDCNNAGGFARLRQNDQRCFNSHDFRSLPHPMTREVHALLDEAHKLQMVPTAAVAPGLSCSQVCKARGDGRRCDVRFMFMLNTCKALRAAFGCERCEESAGTEQPALVIASAPPQAMPGACLYTRAPQQSTCPAKHKLTRRLCPCVLTR